MEGQDHQRTGLEAEVNALALAKVRAYREYLFKKLIKISFAHTRAASWSTCEGCGQ
jgi:hypothetical protein